MPERVLLFCVACGTEWARAGVTGTMATAMVVKGLIERDAGDEFTLTMDGRAVLEALPALSLKEFDPKAAPGGISAAPWGQRRVFPRAFIGKGAQVYARKGAATADPEALGAVDRQGNGEGRNRRGVPEGGRGAAGAAAARAGGDLDGEGAELIASEQKRAKVTKMSHRPCMRLASPATILQPKGNMAT